MNLSTLEKTKVTQAVAFSLKEIESLINENSALNLNHRLKDVRCFFDELTQFLDKYCETENDLKQQFPVILEAFDKAYMSKNYIIPLIDCLNIWIADFKACLSQKDLEIKTIKSGNKTAFYDWVEKRML